MALTLRRLKSDASDFDQRLASLLNRTGEMDGEVDSTVGAIIQRVRANGDAALLSLTQEFDGLKIDEASALEIPRATWSAAKDRIDPTIQNALGDAARRIREFHEQQKEESWQITQSDGTRLGQQVTPLDRVGIYVPGGKASYPSSVLMNAIPAKVAGVGEIIMVVPTPNGEISDTVLACAELAGVDRMFRIGGAQAIAALAYGTQTVPRVDKIVGPGNRYVAAAKKRVFGDVGIDMIAGPSEVVVVCDANAPLDWVAMDLFAQAEHDEQAQSIAICIGPRVGDRLEAQIHHALPQLERVGIVTASLESHGALIEVNSAEEAVEVANRIAPEHLELMMESAQDWLPRIRHAGAIFCGYHSAESLGDYCAGPNHVLPTSGTARFSSPLGVYDFQKRSSVIDCSEAGAHAMSSIASVLARAEGLTAHARSAELRGASWREPPDD
jgi:histidinol dehydrogenase